MCAVDAMPKLAYVGTGITEAAPEDSMDSPRSTTSAMSGVSMTSQGTPRSPVRRAVGYAEAAVGLTGQYLLILTPGSDKATPVFSVSISLLLCWWVGVHTLGSNSQLINS